MSAREYLDTTGLTALWAKIVAKINSAGDAFVKKVGDTMSGQLSFSNTSRNIQVPARSTSYVDGAKGNAGIYMPHTYNKDEWGPIFCVQNKAGGSWSVGSYNGEDLEFVNFTKANIDSSTNSARCNWKLSPTNGFVGPWNGVTDDHNTNNTTDTWVPVYSNNKMQHRVLSATLNNKTVTDASALHNLPSYSADNIPTTKYMAYWNGAYNSSGNSNLRYTAVGSLGTAATINKGALDACDSSVTNVVPRVSGTSTISRIDPGTLRTKMVGWNNACSFDCRWDTVALGIVIANSADSYAMYYVKKPSNGNWVYVYNSAISNTSSTYPQMTTSTFKSGGIQYARATFRGRNNSSWTYWAIWGVSNEASH